MLRGIDSDEYRTARQALDVATLQMRDRIGVEVTRPEFLPIGCAHERSNPPAQWAISDRIVAELWQAARLFAATATLAAAGNGGVRGDHPDTATSCTICATPRRIGVADMRVIWALIAAVVCTWLLVLHEAAQYL